MYDVIFVDFFGVLDNSRYDSWLHGHGYDRNGEYNHLSELTDIGDMDMATFYQKLSDLSGLDAGNIEKEFNSYGSVNKYLVALLHELRSDYRIVLLSNASAPYLKNILDKFGINSLFDEIIISAEIGMIKPNIEIFQYALDKMQVSAQKSIFIDDHQVNIDAACSIGMTGLLYKDFVTFKTDLRNLGVLQS